MSFDTIDNGATFGPKRRSVKFDTTNSSAAMKVLISMMQPPQFLSTFESSLMHRASPISRIESFRGVLRQQAEVNTMLMNSNQD